MDVISDILTHIPVKGHTTGLLSLRGEWAFESPKNNEAVFHVISKGSVLITSGTETTLLREGDMVLFTQGHSHVLSSSQGAPMITFAEEDTRVRIHTVEREKITDVIKQGDGPETAIICARFNFESAAASKLIRNFPNHIALPRESDDTSSWIEPMLRRIAMEARSETPGALAAMDGLLNVLFVHFMRQWLGKSSSEHLGLLKGLLDPHVSKALHMMHNDPAQDWSVGGLATEVGMSRSNFAARFSQIIGEPPLRYLTRWRMIRASSELENQPNRALGEIAMSVGYDSEASFSAAFKRQFGKPPGTWRNDGMLAASEKSISA